MGATSIGVSVREITGAYTMFTRKGEFEIPYTFTKVYSHDGTLLLSHGDKAERLISEESADIMTKMLKNVVTKGTAKGLTLASRVELAGKTGTSNSGGDRWFIGFTPDYVCGVWSGYRDGRDIGEYENNPACTVFDGIMDKVYDSLDKYTKKFDSSKNVIASSYCIDSGELASKACHADLRGNRIETGYFKKSALPSHHCNTHTLVRYDKVTGAVACEKCPEENIVNVGLIKVNRSFPCNIYITDSQYTYRYLPVGTELELSEELPFFSRLQKSGVFFGRSNTKKARNRYCKEHYLETTTSPQIPEISTTTPPTETTAPKESTQSSVPEQEVPG